MPHGPRHHAIKKARGAPPRKGAVEIRLPLGVRRSRETAQSAASTVAARCGPPPRDSGIDFWLEKYRFVPQAWHYGVSFYDHNLDNPECKLYLTACCK